MLGHKVRELIGRVFLAGMSSEQGIEVSEHVFDPLHRLPVRRFQGRLHACELGVENLSPEHLLDGIVDGAGFVGSPVVIGQCSYRPRHIVGQRGELHLGQSGLIVGGRCERFPFGGQSLIQCCLHLIEGAAQIASAPRLHPHPADSLQEPVQTASIVDAAVE